ncbi:hypothetical protein IKH83_00480 [Candidatus Saccharibacteria bacterium]|nr:hypothetical protein [Candidatus Saccharibacteria bacterium]
MGLISGLDLKDPNLTTDNGFGPYLGALCVRVIKAECIISTDEESSRTTVYKKLNDWCEIYVCVSGADSKDDLKCAFAAVSVIADFFEKYDFDSCSRSSRPFSIIAPNPPEDAPTE